MHKIFRTIIISSFSLITFSNCTNNTKTTDKQIVVSIEPLAWLVENLVDSTSSVTVLVPPSTSPENFEPSFRQVENLANSQIYFAIGQLDFEKALQERIKSVAPNSKYVDLSKNMELLAGTCSHEHGDEHEGHKHNHGIDPHTWLSPQLMSHMAHKVASELEKLNILNSNKLDSTLQLIQRVKHLTINNLSKTKNRSFAIVHPSLSYWAKEFNLNQIALEIDGKEPSTKQIKGMVDKLSQNGITKILYSAQNSNAVAQIIANELDIDLVMYDPLAKEWAKELERLSEIIK